MAISDQKWGSPDGKVWGLFRLPFKQSSNSQSSSSSQHQNQIDGSTGAQTHSSTSVSSVARSLLPTRRRLRLDPPKKLYFPYEPGKQVRSAIRIKNTSKSYVAFKFQTTAPKSCFMRPPGAVLAPGESIIATVFKFVEHPENNEKPIEQKNKVKFKIMSLKVKGAMDYVPEMVRLKLSLMIFGLLHVVSYMLAVVQSTAGGLGKYSVAIEFDEQKDQVAVEQILRVVFLDVERPSPALEKLKRQLAEAEAAVEVRKKPPEDTGPKVIGEGLVIDEWKERRERYLARQQIEGIDSV
ncbi:Major sperm protein (MSP) domain [Dillenia turbinata]|uniref:Major sperm protein (MSP) domain n=1 Tax=Dillenia turbinata TaxID=194707 RepID=A0AAN8UII8_9MAGN